MTLRVERINAQTAVYELLLEICKPGVNLTKKELRRRVRAALRHYARLHDVVMSPDCTDSLKDQELFRKAWNAIMAPTVRRGKPY